MKLPKIRLTITSNMNKEFNFNDTDDIGFARSQVKQIDNRIRAKKYQDLKPWERGTNNNIYSSLDKKTRFLQREKRKKIKNNNLSFNWDTSNNYYNKTDIDNIKKCEEIKQQVKIKYDTKYKFREPNITISNFVAMRNETFLTNKMINLIKEGKKNFLQKQENYEKSLKYENKSLDKDIDRFNEFSIKLKKKIKHNDELLMQAIIDNKNLVDLYKKQLQEYNSTVYDIYKNIKSICNYKHYAYFIHKLLGGDNDILHCEINEDINFNEFKNQDISKITQNIFKRTKNILNNNISDEELNLGDSVNINNFDLSFKELEEKIVKKFIEKERNITDTEEIIRRGQSIKEKKKKQYDELDLDYVQQIKELEERKKDYNKLFLTPEEKKNIEFEYELLKDIYSSLIGFNKGIKGFKADNANDMYREVVLPIINQIYNKENKINDLIKLMEKYENENNTIFNKVLTKRKLENRALKLMHEKELINMKENIRRQKYNEKMRKLIIKGRYKYNSSNTPEVVKSSLKRINKTQMNIIDLNVFDFK